MADKINEEQLIKWFNIGKDWLHKNKKNKCIAIFGFLGSSYLIREIYWYIHRKRNNLPPGPNGLPFLGTFYVNLFPSHFKHTPRKWAKQYGPIVYTTLFAGLPFIMISSTKIIKQLFPKKEFLNRAPVFDPKTNYHPSIFQVDNVMPLVTINGNKWTLRRKHAQDCLFRVLTNANVQKIMHQAVTTEIEPYLKNILNENTVWYPREIMTYIAFNTIFHTLFGEQVERNSVLYNELVEDIDNTFKLGTIDVLCMKMPFMKYFFGSKLDAVRHRRNNTILKLIQKRISDNNSAKEKSYVDYTHELVLNGELTESEEIADTYFMFAAGTDTTCSTLEFAVAIMAKNINIEIQDRVRNELLSVMKDCNFNLKFVNNCPLFRAFVYEIFRISSVAFAGVNHVCIDKDYWIRLDNGIKYRIPKNMMVTSNVDYYHVFNKENEHWKCLDGDRIILDNFLENGSFVVNKSWIPFGVGRRDCIGRNLAQKEVQYILGYLLMNYKFTLDKSVNSITDNHKKTNMITAFLDPPIPIRIQKL